jgi:hypothetical protein
MVLPPSSFGARSRSSWSGLTATMSTTFRICGVPRATASKVGSAADPERFFKPPYVGHRGWVGIRLDRGFEDDELLEWAEDAYRAVAPPSLARTLDESARE